MFDELNGMVNLAYYIFVTICLILCNSCSNHYVPNAYNHNKKDWDKVMRQLNMEISNSFNSKDWDRILRQFNMFSITYINMNDKGETNSKGVKP